MNFQQAIQQEQRDPPHMRRFPDGELPCGEWRTLWFIVVEMTLKKQLKKLSRRQQSDLIIRTMCEVCRDVVMGRTFWKYITGPLKNATVKSWRFWLWRRLTLMSS
jgi:hypothetical protein